MNAEPEPRYHSLGEVLRKIPVDAQNKCSSFQNLDPWFDCLGLTAQEKRVLYASIQEHESRSKNSTQERMPWEDYADTQTQVPSDWKSDFAQELSSLEDNADTQDYVPEWDRDPVTKAQ